MADEREAKDVRGRNVTRIEVEDFLYAEAMTLDQWRLTDWLALFEEGGEFYVTTTDWQPGWDINMAGFFVADSYELLQARVKRLLSRKAHAENPRSRTHRVVGNTIVLAQDADTVTVTANFLIHRHRDDAEFTYAGRYEHLLVKTEEGLRFRNRRSVLADEKLEPGARLSFIL